MQHPAPHTNAHGFSLSFDKTQLQLDVIHGFLTESYWAKGISIDLVAQAVEHSLCVGVYAGTKQVAFARLITDYTTFAYLCDVFVLEDYQGKGLGKWMVQALREHPRLGNLRRWLLATTDAHSLYAPFGFTPLAMPERFMQVHMPNIYQQP
ncbi:GNAT family N-acetyltransferase [Rufibacter sp. LB8]|uniref:GNAT family N-acetyltransferase n=1 Tax=Rufibacter sp. LB8 TaxID=2777781 RepID=UPI00178C59F3|nr:GNAT family N-acetyltransferase [Rufibacter sp. LB8]